MKADNDTWNSGSLCSPPSRKEQIYEVSVFLFLILPSMALSFFAFKQGSLGFTVVAVATILRDLALLSLILFFLWRNGEPVSHIGWTVHIALKEVLLGIALFVPFFFGADLLENALQQIGFSVPSKPLHSIVPGKSIPELLLASVLVGVVALAEESIFRGYFILRFGAITGSLIAALLLQAAIFSVGHGYEGSAGVATIGVMGLVFGLIYVWRNSLIAPIVMHFLQDFIGIVLIPPFGGK